MMKTKIYLLFILFLLTWGCDSFLEESSQDLIRPSRVTDLEQILLGDGYGSVSYYSTTIFTDEQMSTDIERPSLQKSYDQLKWLYIWDKNMFTDAGGGHISAFWEQPYKGILGCNLVLDYLDEMKGSDVLRESIRGEALVLRAWYYLHLVNMFGIAYNQGEPSKDLGVPLKLDATVTGEFYVRNTVAEVYDQIEKDLLEGNRLLVANKHERTIYRIDDLAAKAILSRMYLYMENWDKALVYADSVLDVNPVILDLNDFARRTSNSTGGTATVFKVTNPEEIIWVRQSRVGYDHSLSTSNSALGPFVVSSELTGRYERGTFEDLQAGTLHDLRAYFYFTWGMVSTKGDRREFINNGGAWTNKGISDQGIRTAELYLNRAEVYAQKYLKEGNEAYRSAALADLNKLRELRFNKTYSNGAVNITDARELLTFVLDERFRELCGQTNHRWCDLRRYGMTVTHYLRPEGQTYEQEMGRYVLPIPELVMEQNPYLVQNP